MKWIDGITERAVRSVAHRSSRRGFLKKLGVFAAGSSVTIPLLPVARGENLSKSHSEEEGDPNSCDYWRYCAVDGFLCGCCGGSMNTCPPGTEMSPITWIGTCENPSDGKNYIISYNDCCGKSSCGNCLCQRNEGDRPVYQPRLSNDLNWCLGTESQVYNCSTAIVIGTALDK